MKVNPTNMKEAHDELLSIFEKKNADYGNSFEESLEKHGIIAAIVRMEDKMGRLNSLTKKGAEQKVSDESLVDTLKDLSNYALMTAVWLEDKGPEETQPAFADWGKLSPDGLNLKTLITDLMKEKPGMTYFAALRLDNPRYPKSVSFPVKNIGEFQKWFGEYSDKYPYYNVVVELDENVGQTQVQVYSHME
jgi:hypothetical protein|nr:MAG TPA: Nucleotide modification associated domain 1 [Caudoviricetes sp.]